MSDPKQKTKTELGSPCSATESKAPQIKERFVALDIFRGATVAFMILVNNPGSWGAMYPPLQHASWHGCTPTDLVFPFFLFAVGNALALVMPSYQNATARIVLGKIAKRTALIFLIGLALNWSPFVRWNEAGELVGKSWGELRFLGVLQRIAIAFGASALLVWMLRSSSRGILGISVVLLVLYWWLCISFGSETDPFGVEGFWGTAIDRSFLGPNHMYTEKGVPFDPEGIASTLSCVAQVLLGWWIGNVIHQRRATWESLSRILLFGVYCLAAAYVWEWYFPYNKKLWTSSFVLLTTGLASLALGSLVHACHVTTPLKNSFPALIAYPVSQIGRFLARIFESFGKNPLFIFVLSGLVPRFSGLIRWQVPAESGDVRWYTPLSWAYQNVFARLASDPRFGSLAYSVSLLIIYGLIVYVMDHKKVYIRV
jgi:predicted acyltransferase